MDPAFLMAMALSGQPATAAILALPPSAEQTLTLKAGQMLAFGDQAVARADWALAEKVYRGLFEDPDATIRREARLRLARLLVQRDRRSEAALQLRRLLDEWPEAQSARLEFAALLAAMGDDGAARRELRALATSPLPADAARIVERFASALRARRRSGGSLSLALAPDSNINRATRSDTLGTVIGDFVISEDGKARSGIGVALGGEAFARLPLSGRLDLVGRLSGASRLYRHKAFNDVSLGVSAGPEYHSEKMRLALTLGTTRRWFGGARINDIVTLHGEASHALGTTRQLRLGASQAWIDNRRNALERGSHRSVSIGLDQAFSPVMGGGVTLALNRRAARDPAYATRGFDLSAYGWRDLGRVTLGLGVGVSRLEADERLALFPDKREDRGWRVSLGATFRQLSLFGFAPGVTLLQERNRSSVEIHDYTRRAAEFTLRRAF